MAILTDPFFFFVHRTYFLFSSKQPFQAFQPFDTKIDETREIDGISIGCFEGSNSLPNVSRCLVMFASWPYEI